MMWPGDVRNALSTILNKAGTQCQQLQPEHFLLQCPPIQPSLIIDNDVLIKSPDLKLLEHVSSNQCAPAFKTPRTNFWWSQQACGWLVLWKMFGVISLRPLKMRPPLLLLLEGGSSFWRCVKHHTGLSLTSRDCITSTLRHLWETIYIRYRKEVEMK